MRTRALYDISMAVAFSTSTFFYRNRWLVLVLKGVRVEREREKELGKISGEGIKCVFSRARTKRAVCLPFTYLYLCSDSYMLCIILRV